MSFFKWKNEKKRLESLKENLRDLGKIPQEERAVFEYAVKFFNVVSAFQDAGAIDNAPQKFRSEMAELNAHVKNAGRCQYGINRTVIGERVNLYNTFWGGVYGLYTQTSAEWLKGGYAGRVVKLQVRPFLESHVQRLLDLCEQLLA